MARPPSRSAWLSVPALGRMSIALIIGLAAGIPTGMHFHSWLYGALVVWDVTIILAITALWIAVRSMTADETKQHATSEDPGRGIVDAVMLGAGLASLVAVAALIIQSGNVSGTEQAINVGLGVVSVVASWVAVHIIYMLRYAGLYFKEHGSIDFNSKEDPTYQDFAYLALTIGMTYQVSDTSLTSSAQRRIARQHALLSYVFGTAIIATTINALAGLGK